MALISRLGRLFTADMHAVLDRLEEPEQVLHQAMREMESDIAESERRLNRIRIEQTRATRAADDLAGQITGFDDELDLCFDADQEDLARSLIKRKLAVEQTSKLLNQQINQLDEEQIGIESALDVQRSAYREITQKARVFEETTPSVVHTEIFVDADAIEVAFLREKQRRQT